MRSVIVFTILLFATVSESQAEQTRHILILNSYHRGFQWTDDQTSAIEDVLTGSIDNLELYVEYMDTKHIYTPEYLGHVLDVFHLKYDKIKLDAVVATDDNALRFAMKHHEVFSNAPVSFCGINDYYPAMLEGKDAFTGLIEVLDIKATIDLAIKLHEGIQTVYVITDNTPTGIGQQRDVQAVSKQCKDMEFQYLSGQNYSHPELLEKLKTLPENSMVLLAVWLRDKTNTYIPVDEGSPAISSASTVPVYGITTMYLDHGIVGGKLLSSQAQGTKAAELILRVLAGQKPADIGVITESVNPYMFDFTQLQRWNIDKTRLPADSIIVNEPESFYYRYRKIIWIVITIVILESILIIALFITIASRKRAEEALQESEGRFRDFFENAPIGFHIFGADQIITAVNDSELEMTGYSRDEIVGKKTWADLIVPDQKKLFEKHWHEITTKGKASNLEYKLVHKQGHHIDVILNASSRFDASGQLISTRGSILNITKRKQAEAEREQLLKNLSSKNKELQSVVYVASHDLRSPLVNIEGFGGELIKSCQQLEELMRDAVFDETKAKEASTLINEYIPESIKFIKAGTAKMSSLLTGLLQVSRVGSKEVVVVPLDMNRMINNVRHSMEFQINEAGAELFVEDMPNCLGDGDMINQVFANLIGNALKYLDPERKSKIHISGRIEYSNSIYCVEDNGIGIDPAHQDKIFELFHRLNPADTAGGEGLGLTIVTRILDRLNGSITIESQPGKGSKFFISLPTAKP